MRPAQSIAAPVIALLLVTAACSPSPAGEDPAAGGDGESVPAPDRAAAQSLLQAWFDRNLLCTPFFAMPWDVPADSVDGRRRAQAFVDAGLLRAEGEKVIADPASGSGRRTVVRYVPTTDGAREFRPGTGDLRASPVTLCYGRPVVTVAAVGRADPVRGTADVTYRYRLADVPGWARAPSIRALYPGFAERLGGEEEEHQTIRRTAGSWVLDGDPAPARYDLRRLAH